MSSETDDEVKPNLLSVMAASVMALLLGVAILHSILSIELIKLTPVQELVVVPIIAGGSIGIGIYVIFHILDRVSDKKWWV